MKYWKGTEQSNNFEADYYDKGSMVSFLLDVDIRQRTQNARSLDDVMRTMYNRFPLSGPGYTLADFQKVSEELAGGSLKKFFDDYVHGTAPLPWEEYLLRAGLLLSPKDSVQKTWLGAGTTDTGDKTRVSRVTAGSPAYAAGLDLGDEILALDGLRVRTSDLNDRIAERKPGDKVMLTVFHNDHLKEVRVTLGSSPVPAYKLSKIPAPTPLQKSIYEGWLKTTW